MAALTYTIIQQDVDRWGTLADIQENTQQPALKLLFPALDPLLDYRIVNPADAYQVS